MPEKEEQFTPEQLQKALFNIEDLFDRCQLGNTYFLLRKTAKSAKEDVPLYGEGIDVGVEERYLTKEVCSALATYCPAAKHIEEDLDDFEYDFKVGKYTEVPVRVKIIHRNYKFFKYPEEVVYQFEDYQLPNPFDKYWKTRNFIK